MMSNGLKDKAIYNDLLNPNAAQYPRCHNRPRFISHRLSGGSGPLPHTRPQAYEVRIRLNGKVSTTQVQASHVGNAIGLVKQLHEATVLGVKKLHRRLFAPLCGVNLLLLFDHLHTHFPGGATHPPQEP